MDLARNTAAGNFRSLAWCAIHVIIIVMVAPGCRSFQNRALIQRALNGKMFLSGLTKVPEAQGYLTSRAYFHSRHRLPSALKSMRGENFYITTPIYYVNGVPHLGHAYTSVVSDVIARFCRKDGADVFFLTGTDEHGQKVEQSAQANDKTAIEFADETSGKFRDLAVTLNCSHNDFIRTTEQRHKEAVEALWKRLEDNGQIYLGSYEGWYSVRDETFYTETELVGGKAPTGADVEWVREESYFFKLSDWTEPLLQLYAEQPDFIGPKGRLNEVVSFVGQEGGLRDLSISRTTFSWGIPVPGDPKHVCYVWLDALTNYITALGYPEQKSELYKQFWPASLHVVGKDILRFHAVFWPAFLLAAGLPTPKRIFAHGWWTRDGEKMSKSLGNVLDPYELIQHYGVEYLRYYLAAEIHFGNDGDFSHESFCARINSDLANDLGNLAQRALIMVAKHCDSRVPEPGPLTDDDREVLSAIKNTVAVTRGFVEQQSIKNMCDAIILLAKMGNKYIDTQAPWVLVKTDQARMQTVLWVLMELLRSAAILLSPVCPRSCDHLLDQLGVDAELRNIENIGENALVAGTPIGGKPTPVFPKVEPPVAAAAQSAQAESPAAYAEYEGLDCEQLAAKITTTGEQIRAKKTAKAAKEEIKPLIDQLLYLKDRYKSKNGGIAYEAPISPKTA